MDIVKVAVIGIAGVMLSIIMKNSRSEYAQLVALVTAAVLKAGISRYLSK